MTVNFVTIICIALDMLTCLMTNPFVASVLILAIVNSRDPFTYKLEICCRHLQNVVGFLDAPLKFLLIYLFTRLFIFYIVFFLPSCF